MATKSQIKNAVDSRLAAAAARGLARRQRGDLARSATYDARRKRLQIELVSGSAVAIPVSQVEGLSDAKAAQIRAVKIVGGGYGLHWPALDLDHAVAELVAGCFGTRAWMSTLGRKAGQATSEAKAAAARKNGRKGGRPRKVDRNAESGWPEAVTAHAPEADIPAFEASRRSMRPPR